MQTTAPLCHPANLNFMHFLAFKEIDLQFSKEADWLVNLLKAKRWFLVKVETINAKLRS